MDEATIISQGQVSTPVIDGPPEGTLTPDIDLKTKMDLFTNLEIPLDKLSDDETSAKIRDIYDWGKITGISEDQMIIALNEISSRLGRMVDKSQFDNVWEWVRLDVERKKIESKMKSMENRIGS